MSEDILNFKELLTEIPGENRAGEALRQDYTPGSLFQKIEAARVAARDVERNPVSSITGEALPPADWNPILVHAPEVLTRESKDLEVAIWLVEALVRKHGFAGLRDGFRLIRELAECFWDELHPRSDEPEDSAEGRVRLLGGFQAALIVPLQGVPMTSEGTERAFSLADYKQAGELEKIDPERRVQRIDRGAVSMTMFERAVVETPRDALGAIFDDLQECIQQFNKLCETLDEKCGEDEKGYSRSPSFSDVRELLEECDRVLRVIGQDVLGLTEELDSEEEGGEGGGANGEGKASGEVRTREDAFRTISRLAEFFRRSEPHSPISYELDRIVRWGKMPLPQLLGELIPDQTAREQFCDRTGVVPPPEEEYS